MKFSSVFVKICVKLHYCLNLPSNMLSVSFLFYVLKKEKITLLVRNVFKLSRFHEAQWKIIVA